MSTPMTTKVASALAPALAGAPGANGTVAADPLAALRGIHLPEAVGLWPLAHGWWVALAVGIGIAILAVVAIRVRRASLAHHALRELDRLDESSGDLQGVAIALSALLRRVALKRFGRSRVASLHGTAWQEFLTETSPHEKRRRASIDEDMGRLIALAPYAPPGSPTLEFGGASVGRDGVLVAARDWIRWNT